MRAAPDDYVLTLERFTLLDMPTRKIPITAASQPPADTPPERRLLLEPVPVPVRGEPLGEARRKIQSAGYGDVLALSRELTRDAPTAYDAVKAIERHLQSGFTYTEAPPQDDDRPLRSFLLTDRVGYCQQFSGAMALMLRMNGIPARVVSGFSPGVAADEPGVFTVRDTDAHSWTEVYFMGIGWVPFDPTPAASPAQSQASLNAIAATPGDIPAGKAQRRARPAPRVGLTQPRMPAPSFPGRSSQRSHSFWESARSRRWRCWLAGVFALAPSPPGSRRRRRCESSSSRSTARATAAAMAPPSCNSNASCVAHGAPQPRTTRDASSRFATPRSQRQGPRCETGVPRGASSPQRAACAAGCAYSLRCRREGPRNPPLEARSANRRRQSRTRRPRQAGFAARSWTSMMRAS